PLKPGLFGRMRHELDSSNMGGHFPHHPSYNLLFKLTELGKDEWTPYPADHLNDFRTLPPLQRSETPVIMTVTALSVSLSSPAFQLALQTKL
ncbi:hypothetical protein AVEN_135849-1, partial [Araneus ventricosus]